MPDLSVDGARVRAVPSSVVQRVVDGVRYAITGVAPANWFGPMQPLAPMAPADVAGRRFDYPTGYNLQYEPRAYEPVTFSDLRALADNCDILRLVIETRKDQIEAQDWDIRPKRQDNGDRPKSSAFASEIGFARSFFASPDREHDFASWTRQVAEEMFVTDATSIYKRPDRSGRAYAFELIDGSTIAPRIDAWGRMPQAPDVAYQQVLHGIPAADFSADQLIYFPRNKRPGHVYGKSPVEQIIVTVNIAMRRALHQLAYYTDGNLADAIFVAPDAMTSEQLKGFQSWWDSRFRGNVNERRNGVWVPKGTDHKAIQQPQLKDAYDEFLARIVCFCFSISPQPFVSQVNRATAETAKAQAAEEGLAPVLNWLKRLLDLLLQRHLGFADLEFIWVDDRETDPAAADAIDVADVKAGIRTINEVRTSRGLDPMPGADALMLATGSGYVPLDAARSVAGKQIIASKLDETDLLRKDWESDLHPRWPRGASDSQGGQFAPKRDDEDGGGEILLEDAVYRSPADDNPRGNSDVAQGHLDDAVYRSPADGHPGDNTDDGGTDLEDVAYRSPVAINLLQEEARGGHTIAVHVGKSRQYLLNRIRTERLNLFGFVAVGLKRAGSFPSVTAANKLVNSTLSQNTPTVNEVAQGTVGGVFLKAYFHSPTGIEAFAPNDTTEPYIRDTFGVGVYIIHDSRSPKGFTVVTAYPRND